MYELLGVDPEHRGRLHDHGDHRSGRLAVERGVDGPQVPGEQAWFRDLVEDLVVFDGEVGDLAYVRGVQAEMRARPRRHPAPAGVGLRV
ncbi:hypothetical protein ACIRU3_25840 [Streptomyces sp. NPDC101151]|uniref:hypothetical protein n=1 Tax=Streptomyces sp. NPDC101151 TaxID=3366115 RepID=UPI00380DB436